MAFLRTGAVLALSILLCWATASAAAPALRLAAYSVLPTFPASLSGTGFGASEVVDIYVDTTDTALVLTGTTGSFTARSLPVPVTTAPGVHWITAVGRHSGLAAQTTLRVSTPWGQQGYSQTGVRDNVYETILTIASVSGLDVAWNGPRPAPAQLAGTPVVNQGVAFASSDDGSVTAFDAVTGVRKWTNANVAVVNGNIAAGHGLIYATTSGGVRALNAGNGTEKWFSSCTGQALYSPTLAGNGLVYVTCFPPVSGPSHLEAINALTGALVWSAQTDTSSYVDGAPVVTNGLAIVASGNMDVLAFDAATGAPRWSTQLTGFLRGESPAAANGLVFISSIQGGVYALNVFTGATVWRWAPISGSTSGAPALQAGQVIVGDLFGNIYSLSQRTGAVLWSGSYANGQVVGVSVAGGVAYAAIDNGTVLALDARTGASLWTATAGSSLSGAPAVSDGMVYVSPADQGLTAFAPNGGAGTITMRSARAMRAPVPAALRPDRRLSLLQADPAPRAAVQNE